jgi:hypothetical protein
MKSSGRTTFNPYFTRRRLCINDKVFRLRYIYIELNINCYRQKYVVLLKNTLQKEMYPRYAISRGNISKRTVKLPSLSIIPIMFETFLGHVSVTGRQAFAASLTDSVLSQIFLSPLIR